MFLFLPAGNVMLGAFKTKDGAWTTELQVAKAEGVAVVAGAAMGAVARATVHAQHLAAAVPAAEPRLVAILDALTTTTCSESPCGSSASAVPPSAAASTTALATTRPSTDLPCSACRPTA